MRYREKSHLWSQIKCNLLHSNVAENWDLPTNLDENSYIKFPQNR
jgi:hypothetical protein